MDRILKTSEATKLKEMWKINMRTKRLEDRR